MQVDSGHFTSPWQQPHINVVQFKQMFIQTNIHFYGSFFMFLDRTNQEFCNKSLTCRENVPTSFCNPISDGPRTSHLLAIKQEHTPPHSPASVRHMCYLFIYTDTELDNQDGVWFGKRLLLHWKCNNILSTFILQAKSMFHYKPYNFWFSTVGMGSKAAGRLHLQCTICTSTFSPPKITHWRARNSGLTWSMLAPMCPFIIFFFPRRPWTRRYIGYVRACWHVMHLLDGARQIED